MGALLLALAKSIYYNIITVAPSLIQVHLAVKKFSSQLFFVFNSMVEKLCKEQQISFGNIKKYSDFVDGKYILLN